MTTILQQLLRGSHPGSASATGSVTDKAVSSNKKGCGLLIRTLKHGQQQQQERPPSSSSLVIDGNIDDDDDHGQDRNCDRTNKKFGEFRLQQQQQQRRRRRPSVGDICRVYCDCYVVQDDVTTTNVGPGLRTTTTTTTTSLGRKFRLRDEKNLVSVVGGGPVIILDDDNNDNNGCGRRTVHDDNGSVSLSSSSLSPPPILEFQIGKGDVIRGLEVAVQRLVPGQIVEVVCPSLYAYGDRGHPPQIPPHATLCLVIELLDVVVTSNSKNSNNRMKRNKAATDTTTTTTSWWWWGWSWW